MEETPSLLCYELFAIINKLFVFILLPDARFRLPLPGGNDTNNLFINVGVGVYDNP